MNPEFFRGTAIEGYAAKVLSEDADWKARS
jgi:hypothetical protein